WGRADGVVVRVAVDELEVAMVEAAIVFGAEHADELGAAARSYVEREHSLERVADAYAAAIEVAAGGDAVDGAVLLRIAEAAAEVGHSDPSSLARAALDAGIVE